MSSSRSIHTHSATLPTQAETDKINIYMISQQLIVSLEETKRLTKENELLKKQLQNESLTLEKIESWLKNNLDVLPVLQQSILNLLGELPFPKQTSLVHKKRRLTSSEKVSETISGAAKKLKTSNISPSSSPSDSSPNSTNDDIEEIFLPLTLPNPPTPPIKFEETPFTFFPSTSGNNSRLSTLSANSSHQQSFKK